MYYLRKLALLIILVLPHSLLSQIETNLYQAIIDKDLTAIATIINDGVYINKTDENGANALMWAVYKSDLPVVKFLVEKGATIPQKGIILLQGGSYGNLTGIAAGEGKLDMLKYLIEELKLPVDGKEYNSEKDTLNGWTALQWGSSKNQVAVVDYLVKQEADTILAALELGKFYRDQKEYSKELNLLEEAKRQVFKDQGKLNETYGKLLNNIGEINFYSGSYKKAELLFLESKGILGKVLGNRHSEYAISVNNLAVLSYILGKYEISEPLFKESSTILEETVGKEHPNYATSLSNLAALNIQMGNYREAEQLLIESIKLITDVSGKENVNYATSIDNLGTLNTQLGKYEEAILLFKESIIIRERKLGKLHSSYVTSLANLGVVYSKLRNYEKADSIQNEVLSIREKTVGKKHPIYLNALNDLAISNERLGKYEIAESLHKEIIITRDTLFGKKHPAYIVSLSNLAGVYFEIGKYREANSLDKEVLELKSMIFGKEHLSYATSLRHLAETYQVMGEHKEAEKYLLDHFPINRNLIENSFTFLSESEKQKYLSKNFEYTRKLNHSFAINNSTSLFKNLQYNLALFSKGLQLNTSKATQSFIFQQADSTELDNYYELLGIQRRLIKEYEKPIAKRTAVTELETQKENLEKQLARASSFYRQEQTASKINYQDIQRKLKAGEATIEFVHFNYQNPKPTDSILYAAAVLLPNATHVHYIPLFEEKQLTQQIAKVRSDKGSLINQAYAVRGLTPKVKKINFKKVYNLVWKPLDSLLAGVTTIYYSPSGLLHRLNMNALPIGKKKILADKYQLVQLSSTRSIALGVEERKDDLTAYVVGGVQYDITTSLLPEKIEIDTTAISLAAKEDYFSYTARSLRGERWNFLPGTLKESRDITAITQNVGYTVNYRTGNGATEEDFKTLGTTTKSPAIIHLATHGFFFPDVKDSLRNHSKEPIFKISEHPMLRSGLLLAGANGVWEGAISLADEEDGILTAMEISQMNLSNTEIVVLSACETGLGDIQGSEGVYGLQRAFKKAGVKYLIMSLWQVPDEETAEFMTLFYKNWLEEKKSIPEAFNQTQKEMRKKYKKPHQWAGFVLVE